MLLVQGVGVVQFRELVLFSSASRCYCSGVVQFKGVGVVVQFRE